MLKVVLSAAAVMAFTVSVSMASGIVDRPADQLGNFNSGPVTVQKRPDLAKDTDATGLVINEDGSASYSGPVDKDAVGDEDEDRDEAGKTASSGGSGQCIAGEDGVGCEMPDRQVVSSICQKAIDHSSPCATCGENRPVQAVPRGMMSASALARGLGNLENAKDRYRRAYDGSWVGSRVNDWEWSHNYSNTRGLYR